MCYLVAKRFDRIGSVALRTRHGKKLVTFTKEVDQRFAGKNIQLVTISKPKAYNEYAPYKMVDSEEEAKKGLIDGKIQYINDLAEKCRGKVPDCVYQGMKNWNMAAAS